MFSRMYCGQIELSVATLFPPECAAAQQSLLFSHRTFSRSRAVVLSHSFASIRPFTHSSIHPFTENKLTHTHARSHYREQEWMCFSSFFFFISVLCSFSCSENYSMIVRRNDESTYGQIKKMSAVSSSCCAKWFICAPVKVVIVAFPCE